MLFRLSCLSWFHCLIILLGDVWEVARDGPLPTRYADSARTSSWARSFMRAPALVPSLSMLRDRESVEGSRPPEAPESYSRAARSRAYQASERRAPGISGQVDL